jgi:hypothetical protein
MKQACAAAVLRCDAAALQCCAAVRGLGEKLLQLEDENHIYEYRWLESNHSSAPLQREQVGLID